MRKKFLLMTFLTLLFTAMGTNLLRAENGNVAKVGNTEYATIDDAIAAWTNGTTLTLLADVTLSDVVTINSTEHHILNLSTYTMTAASGKNAFVIKACGTGAGEQYAITINADATNPGGINAGSKCIIYYKYADGGISTEDRPIIKINGGVFTGSTSSWGTAGIYTIGTAARKCATLNISGGTFNCSINGSGKSKLLVSGGVFNYSVGSTGDSTCYRLISGGTFKSFGFMTADSNNTKFWIGTSMANSDVGAYIDDNGYLVVGGPVVTEPGTNFEASSPNHSNAGFGNYLTYSSVATNGIYYTSVEEALTDNNKTDGSVTVYVDELDMADFSSYKGTIVVPEGSRITITNAPADLNVVDKDGNAITPNENGTYTTVTPEGNDFTGYTRTDAIWGEVWGNAYESFVIKVLDANGNVMGTTSLNNVDGIINGNVNVTWSLKLDAASNTDEYWTMNWTTAPSIGTMPAKVELWVDGVKVSGGDVVLNAPDNLNPIYAAVTDNTGKILAYHTNVQEAIKAAAPSGTVEILSDVTVDEWIMFSETLNIGSGQIITMNIDGLTINGNGKTVTIKDIESAGNGGYLIFDATNLNVKDLTINYADGLVGGIGLSSGTISNVTFNGGNYGVFPGANGVTIEDCTFIGTKSSAVYYEEGRQGIVVENNIFNTADGAYAITMRSDEQFTGNTINKGRVNIANSSSATVTDNNFGQERFKVYNAATATISENTINNLVFNETNVPTESTFTENILSPEAQAAIDALPALAGEGTEENPYTISNLAQLKAFRDDVNTGNTYQGKYVALTADIDLNNEEWTPIGNDINRFKGYFDGNEKTISNLKVTGNTRYKGFFGYIKGTEMSATTTPSVKDLTLDGVNVNVEGDGYFVGGLAGQAYTCNITNVTVKGNVSGVRYVGGLVGHVYTYFKDCHFIGNASCSFYALGGIAGAGDCRAYDCSVIGDITGSNWVGGIVGNGQEGTSAVGCYVKGDVKTSTNWYFGVGGIAGVAGHGYSSSEFKNNYFDGKVYLEGEKVPAMIIGIVNAENNETIYATIEGNSWNTIYYDVNIPVYVTAEAPQNGTTENWIAGASEELTKPRNNNLIMLKSDLQYVTEEDYVIMSFSEVTEEQVEQALINNAVAKIGETTYTTLQKALDAAVAGTGNVTVEIIKDIDLTNVDWNPVTVSAPGYPVVTVEGNNKTITGLNDMLFAGTWAGGSGLIINDLTIANSNIVHDENDSAGNIGVGAFIGFPQASATITLNKCHLVNSTVNGGHWTGGLIGMAGGYNGNDGPVFMNLTIKDCSVTGSIITGKGSCGGIIGHGSCAAWTAVKIQNTTVSGNTVTSTGSSTNKAGAVMGTIGAAGQPTTANGVTLTGGAMVDAIVSGNTVKSNNEVITTIYGRQGTDTGILELNGGTYDNYPIEQNVAYAKPAAGLMIEQNEYGTYGLVEDPAYGKVAMIGETYYETLSAAFAAVPNDEQTVVILSDVTEKLEGANLRGNITTKDGTKVTITLTNEGWVHCPYTFILGENITLNVPALFYYAGGAQINGTVVAGAYYQRYANSKLTINEPGSMKVTTETFIVRYMDADPNAGIYIIGDNNDETIGLDASVIYFYQGMINAKDADIKVGTYWQTNETDNNEGSANLVLDNSNMTVTVNEHNMKATANSTVTLTNGSNVTVAGGYQGVGVSIDATSSMTMARSIFVSKINNYHYTSLQEAATAAQDGETIELLWQEGQASIAMNASLYGNKNVTITGTATVDWSKGFLFVGRGGEGNATLTFNNAILTSASNSASYGIHVSGREKNTNNKYDGTVNINNSTIDLDYLINKGTMTLDNSTLTVKNGFAVGGRPASETESGEDATATITLNNGSKVVVNNHNGMGLGYEAIGIMNINSGSTFECTQDFLVTAKGTMNIDETSNAKVTDNYTLQIMGNLNSAGDITGGISNTDNNGVEVGTIILTGGTYTQDVNSWCAQDYIAKDNQNGTWTVIRNIFHQTTALANGWNWYSSYINDDVNALGTLQAALGTNGVQIKDDVQYTNYYENIGWYGRLTTIAPNETMYMIKTSAATNVEIKGAKVDPSTITITIQPGWNYISYPLDVAQSITTALGFTPQEDDIIKGKGSGAVYMVGTNGQGWFEEFNMEPGQGYMYKSNAATTITFNYSYPTGGAKSSMLANVETIDYHWTVDAHKYANSMNMIAMVNVDGEMVKGGYEVAAFSNEGECRGTARPFYVEDMDAYLMILTIHGEEVENLTFRYYDIDTDTEYELNNVVTYSDNAIVGTIDNPYIFTMNILGIGENSIDNINIYPNPTTTDREINLNATFDKVEVYNALGVKVVEYQNVDTIDALETAGIYVIRVTDNNGDVKHCRLVVK